MAHLEKLPTYFVRGDERRAAYYTIQARELLEDGWHEEGGDDEVVAAKVGAPLPEIVVEAGVDAYDDDSEIAETEESLHEMTKQELLDYAMEHGVDLKNSLPKSEVLRLCLEIKA
jgi:hypothetical protein